MVPLTGHTPGHCGVAVKSAGEWILHAGDAVPFDVAIDRVPAFLTRLVLGPHAPRINAFMQAHPEVQVVGAHMDLSFYSRTAGPEIDPAKTR